ncbi:hypothetical protein [Sulfuricurvum sp.]|uniref:hypothetical protein n=1 Tax=Sulfuricurvum sp. TaxID=2025608 RepID=UPI0035664BE4
MAYTSFSKKGDNVSFKGNLYVVKVIDETGIILRKIDGNADFEALTHEEIKEAEESGDLVAYVEPDEASI